MTKKEKLVVILLSIWVPAIMCAIVYVYKMSYARDSGINSKPIGTINAEGFSKSPDGNSPSGALGQSQKPSKDILGESVEKREILCYSWNKSQTRPVLVIAAIHGDERSAGNLGTRLLEEWTKTPDKLEGVYVILIPLANPDGWAKVTRQNANHVDFNRNFPADWKQTKPSDAEYTGPGILSEPEAQVIDDLIKTKKPKRIISFHSCSSCGGQNNYDGPADAVANEMSKYNRYKVTSEWLKPTPGSLGRYAGKQLGIPIVTLELPRALSGQSEWDNNMKAIEAAVALP